MGFQQGLSGLNAAARNLDVSGNNIANASTVGFKTSNAQFADVYASSVTGVGGLQVGVGTKVGAVAQSFTQGNITVTNNPLDLAISGEGFFQVNQGGVVSYTRNGQFNLDKDGYIVNADKQRLTGYGVDALGNIVGGVPVDIHISLAPSPPKATSTLKLDLNLDSRQSVIAGAINPANATTYNHSTAYTVYDAAGNAHGVVLYFQKAAANAWNVDAYVNGVQVDMDPAGAGNTMTLSFNPDGSLANINGVAAAVVNLTIPAATLGTGAGALTYAANFTGFTQYGSVFGVSYVGQDGYSSGQISGLSVDSDGIINGRYSNGQSRTLGQVILHSFLNPQGLLPMGNNLWVQTGESGQAVVGAPGSGILGVIQSGAVEESNVDLTAELVNLIVAQRMYQANAQTVRAQDQILQTLVNLR
jgi:flagellar hook protein FlgE